MRKRFETLSYLLDDFRSLRWPWNRLVFAGIAGIVLLLIVIPRFMIPFLLVVIGIAFYLRYSRPKDSL